MKKTISLLLAVILLLGMNSAFALNYSGNLGNEATFETMGEARANAPAAMEGIIPNSKYMTHPVLDGYPEDTTYIYRSANMYGRNGAVRINTNIVVFTEQVFETKDAAYAYLMDLGLIDIIGQALGSVVLVTPADKTAFGPADQQNYYKLQTSIFSQGAGIRKDDVNIRFVEPVYYGGYGYLYVIGVDGGATFVNNYVAGTLDYVSRIGGMLLVGGGMDRIRGVADFVPVYLVNAPEAVAAKYEKANGADALLIEGDKRTSYNQAFPARKVVTVESAEPDLKELVNDAYYGLFIKAVRGQELLKALNSASAPYQGYSNDQAPYSLSVRNALVDGVTADGIHEFTRVDDRFAAIQTPKGEYLQTWFEYIPEEIVNGTAKPGTIPMILTLHGGGDDPRQYVDGQGYLELAGAERLVLVSPDKAALHTTDANGNTILSQVLPELVKYMLQTYPAIDASRVYVTGYSMGSLATFEAIFGDPSLFAAAFPQAGIAGIAPTEAQAANYKNVDLPIMISTSEYDSPKNVDPVTKGIVEEFHNLINTCLTFNEMENIPAADFDAYPRSGFKADVYASSVVNGDYAKHSWTFLNDEGVPMVGLTYMDDMIHCLYPQYANVVWDFVKHYSRNQETGAIVYNPYVR